MKNTGLKNRFPDDVKYEWDFWYECMVCGMNGWDCLHHTLSITVRHYKTGNFNKSILNSCPLCNFKCHIGNDGFLHKDETIKMLLNKVKNALIDELKYELKPIDKEFLSVYQDLY